jgi:hypothetical protein
MGPIGPCGPINPELGPVQTPEEFITCPYAAIFKPVEFIGPLTCSLSTPLSVPVPKRALPEYCAILTSPDAFTSIEGIPETSFTENIVPVMSFVTENNCPAEPSKLSVPLFVGYT